MTRSELVALLSAVPDLTVREGEPLSRHGAWRLGGPVSIWLTAETEAAVGEAATLCATGGVAVRTVQGRSWVAGDTPADGAYLGLGRVGVGLEAARSADGWQVDIGGDHPAAALYAWATRAGAELPAAIAGRAGSSAPARVAQA